MEFLKKCFSKRISLYIILIFVFVFIFSSLIPMGGDDFGNYLKGGLSFAEKIDLSILYYNIFEGRFFSRIFDLILVPNELLLVFVKAISITLIFYLMCRILNASQKYYPLILMAILFVDYQVFGQVYVWRTGFVTYFIPMVFLIFLIFVRKNCIFDLDVKIEWWNYLLFPLALIFSMFVENVAVGIIMVCILELLLYFLKYRKIDIPILLCLIFSVIGFCFMYFSSGTTLRAASEDAFSSLNFFDKILFNVSNFVNYIFIKNSFLLFLFIVVMSIIVIRKVKNNLLRILLLLFIILPAFITSILNVFAPFGFLPDVLLKILNCKNIFIEIYWILFTILFLILVTYYFKFDKAIWFFLIIAFSNAMAMMISPIWGGRTICLTSYMLFMALILMILKFDLKIFDIKKFRVFMNFICFGFMVLFCIYSIYIYNLNNDRVKYINYQLENDSKEFEIIILPGYYTWNLNTWGSDGDFAYSFKEFYGINKEAKLIYVNNKNTKVDVDKLKG